MNENERTAAAASDASPLPRPPRAELAARRRRITSDLLAGLTILGGLAYVPGVWAGVLVGQWWVVVMDTVVYAAIVITFLRRGLSDRTRALSVVGVAWVLGASLSLVFGPNGGGALWLCAVPVLTALLAGRRATIVSLVLVVLALGVVTVLRALDLLAWDVSPGGTLLWLIISGNVVLIAGALALAVTALIGGLTEAAERTQRYGAALAREQEALLVANEQLERALADRARAEARLRQTEKLTAIGTLARGIAHDMNNLLVPILGGAELLRAREPDGSERAELLDRSLDAARTARDLVERILAFASPSGENRVPLDAAVAFKGAARLLHAALPPEVGLSFEAGADAGIVLLSQAEAHQIVQNLVTNAADAMPQGGQITLVVDSVRAGDQPADVAAPESNRFVRLTVADHGIGMDEETMRRMFEPFFTRRPPSSAGSGHGIGLTTVYGIVSAAGGYIVPWSRPGAGTRMEVYLPHVDRPVPIERPESSAPPRAEGERVLLVDDDEAVRALVAHGLRSAGFEVQPAEGGEEALRRLGRGESFDVVVTDRLMPGIDGLELAQALRERYPALPVVIMSGIVDDELRARAAELDVHELVAKPLGIRDLPASIATAMGRRAAPNGTS